MNTEIVDVEDVSTIQRDRHNGEKPFIVINKSLTEDERLSWKAKGVLIYLLGKPDDWIARVTDIVRHGTDGEAAIQSALRELLKFGYTKIIRLQNKDTSVMEGNRWVFSEFPKFDPSAPIERVWVSNKRRAKEKALENPGDGKPGGRKTRGTENRPHTKEGGVASNDSVVNNDLPNKIAAAAASVSDGVKVVQNASENEASKGQEPDGTTEQAKSSLPATSSQIEHGGAAAPAKEQPYTMLMAYIEVYEQVYAPKKYVLPEEKISRECKCAKGLIAAGVTITDVVEIANKAMRNTSDFHRSRASSFPKFATNYNELQALRASGGSRDQWGKSDMDQMPVDSGSPEDKNYVAPAPTPEQAAEDLAWEKAAAEREAWLNCGRRR